MLEGLKYTNDRKTENPKSFISTFRGILWLFGTDLHGVLFSSESAEDRELPWHTLGDGRTREALVTNDYKAEPICTERSMGCGEKAWPCKAGLPGVSSVTPQSLIESWASAYKLPHLIQTHWRASPLAPTCLDMFCKVLNTMGSGADPEFKETPAQVGNQDPQSPHEIMWDAPGLSSFTALPSFTSSLSWCKMYFLRVPLIFWVASQLHAFANSPRLPGKPLNPACAPQQLGGPEQV